MVWTYRSEIAPQVRAQILEVVLEHRCPSTLDLQIAALDDAHPANWQQALDGLVVLATPEAEHRLRVVAGGRSDGREVRRALCEEAIGHFTESIAGRWL